MLVGGPVGDALFTVADAVGDSVGRDAVGDSVGRDALGDSVGRDALFTVADAVGDSVGSLSPVLRFTMATVEMCCG